MGFCNDCSQSSSFCCCSPKKQKSNQGQSQVQVPVQVQDGLDSTQIQDGPEAIQNATQNATQGPQNQLQRHGNQRNGDQTNEGHTNISPLQNNQSISTPVDVSGVNVNVKCGDFMPFPYPFPFPIQKCTCCPDSPYCKKLFGHEKENEKFKDKDCCTEALSEFLCFVRDSQRTIEDDPGVDIYLTSATTLGNPIEDQVITDVESCLVRFRPADEASTSVTAVELCNFAGICVSDVDPEEQDLYDLILDYVNNLNTGCNQTKDKCSCSCCAKAIGEELNAARRYSQLTVTLHVNGIEAPNTDLSDLTVLLVKDCLAYFTNAEEDTIYVFSLCAITGVTVDTAG